MIEIKDDRSEKVKYDFPDFPIYIRRCRLAVFPNCTADKHWHDDIELISVLSGEMKYNVNEKIITLRQGEGIIVNSGQLHFGYSDVKSDCDFICVLFHPVLLCASKTTEKEFVQPFIQADISHIHLQNSIWQKEILKNIFELWHGKESGFSPLYFQGRICFIGNELAENVKTEKEKSRNESEKISLLKNMLMFIHENYKNKIMLDDIAKAANISKRNCENIFLKYLNQTPSEYLCDYRIRKSIELLRNTDMTVLEISYEVGFSGASYFSETFKKHYGITPSRHRKESKQNTI